MLIIENFNRQYQSLHKKNKALYLKYKYSNRLTKIILKHKIFAKNEISHKITGDINTVFILMFYKKH